MNAKPRDTIHVKVEYNTEDEEYGAMYIASCDEISVVTDGKTMDELLVRLREAISLHLEDLDAISEFNLVPNPKIILSH
jgi:predicted RNase H-like HicB family nuclease